MGNCLRGPDGRYLSLRATDGAPATSETTSGAGAACGAEATRQTPVGAARRRKARASAKKARKRAAGTPLAQARKGWTPEKEAIFFRQLGILCNVSAALRKAGASRLSRTIYDRRKLDLDFRARWDEALEESIALLELELNERARFGANRPEPETEVEKALRAVPTPLALQLLKLYAGRRAARAAATAEQPVKRRDPARRRALRREFDALLSEYNRRMGGNG